MSKVILTLSTVATILFSGVIGVVAVAEVTEVYQAGDSTVIVYTNPMGN